MELAHAVSREAEDEAVRLKALTLHAEDGLTGLMFIENAADFAAP